MKEENRSEEQRASILREDYFSERIDFLSLSLSLSLCFSLSFQPFIILRELSMHRGKILSNEIYEDPLNVRYRS